MICDEFYYRSNRLHRAQTMLLVEWKIRSVSFSKFSGLRPHLPRRHLENWATEEGHIEGLANGGRWWELQHNHVHVPSCTYILYTYVCVYIIIIIIMIIIIIIMLIIIIIIVIIIITIYIYIHTHTHTYIYIYIYTIYIYIYIHDNFCTSGATCSLGG